MEKGTVRFFAGKKGTEKKPSGMVITQTIRRLLAALAVGLVWNSLRAPDVDLSRDSLLQKGSSIDRSTLEKKNIETPSMERSKIEKDIEEARNKVGKDIDANERSRVEKDIDEVLKMYNDLFEMYIDLYNQKQAGALVPPKTTGQIDKIGNIIRTEGTNNVCLIVRTYPKQASTLRVLLHGILDAASSVSFSNGFTHPSLAVQVILADTDPNSFHKPPEFLYDILQDMDNNNRKNSNNFFNVQMQVDRLEGYNAARDCITENGLPDYGYCITQYLLEQYILKQKAACDWVLFTNGDNFLSKYIFQQTRLHSRSLDASPDMILFDFVSNHGRLSRDGSMRKNQLIQVQAWVDHLDLSSVFFKAKAIRNCPASTFKPYRFAEDWYFVERLINQCGATNEVIPEVLLVHQ